MADNRYDNVKAAAALQRSDTKGKPGGKEHGINKMKKTIGQKKMPAKDTTAAAGAAAELMKHTTDREKGGGGGDETAIVSCTTTAGKLVLHLHRAWSPHGYDRAVALWETGYYDGSHLFRAVPDFLVQFGISYATDAALQTLARHTTIPDDPQLDPPVPFVPGTISYAGT